MWGCGRRKGGEHCSGCRAKIPDPPGGRHRPEMSLAAGSIRRAMTVRKIPRVPKGYGRRSVGLSRLPANQPVHAGRDRGEAITVRPVIVVLEPPFVDRPC